MSPRLALAAVLACGMCMSATAQYFAVGSLEQSYDGWEVVPWESSHVNVSAFVAQYNGNGAWLPSLTIDATNDNCCFQTQFDTRIMYPYTLRAAVGCLGCCPSLGACTHCWLSSGFVFCAVLRFLPLLVLSRWGSELRKLARSGLTDLVGG